MSENLLYVGLDHNDYSRNIDTAEMLSDANVEGNFGFKINQDHMFNWGLSYIQRIVELGRPVFADLKMNNGARTMSNTIQTLAGLGVRHTNIWAHAEKNLADTMEKVRDVEGRPDVLAVTFYTRWDDEYAQKHHHMTLEELISHWSHNAIQNGADGLILPGNHLASVRDLDVPKLNPAVRIAGEATDSAQKQVSDPYTNVMEGASLQVVASPVIKAAYPVEALKTYLGEIKRAEQDLAT